MWVFEGAKSPEETTMSERPASTTDSKRLERLHSRVRRSRKGYRVDRSESMGRDEPADMVALERRGLVMFVIGWGWVDSEPALQRAARVDR